MTQEKAETTKTKQAEMGETIQILSGVEKGKKGKVVMIRENSVIAEIGINTKKNEPIKTVVNHKHYKVVK